MQKTSYSYNDFKKQLNQMQNDPYYTINRTYNDFDGNVPRILRKPHLSDYGLTENVKKELEEIEIADRKKDDHKTIIIYLVGLVVVAFLFYHFMKLSLWAIIAATLSTWSTAFLFFGAIFGKRPNYKDSDMHRRYAKYLSDSSAYNYWQELETVQYWTSLDGHGFENACASVFRKKGYEAVVSKAGGDGGIDIVLTKGSEKIAVQCKAHKTAVSPSVARDLYGTMQHFGYKKGMLISTNGFTNGVYEFVKDKHITLYTLNDIIKMANS